MYSGYARILDTSYFILRFPGRVPPEWPNFFFLVKNYTTMVIDPFLNLIIGEWLWCVAVVAADGGK